MEYLNYALNLNRGDTVRVTLNGRQAYVYLLDGPNFQFFKTGLPATGIGGLFNEGAIDLNAPAKGTWYLVAYLGALPGPVGVQYQILPAQQYTY